MKMDINTILQRGEALFGDGLLDEAETVFQELLRLKPDHYEALNNIGVIKHNRGNIEQAEQFFLKALAVNGEYLDALFNLADLYQNVNQNEKALNYLEKLLILQPDNCDLLNRLAFICIELKQKKPAISLIKRSLKLCPDQKTLEETLSALLPDSSMDAKKQTRANGPSPLVSVGLPVYNGEKYIAEAIESILGQDFEKFELIISDNHSNDKTGEICDKYSKIDKRIRYIRLEENIGMKLNFMNVLGLATAPYFMWATHDDLHEKAFMGKCIKALQGDDSISLAYTQTKLLNADSQFLGIAKDYVKADQDNPVERFKSLIWQLGICNMVLGLFRTSLLRKSTSLNSSLFADTLLLAEVTLSGKIIQIPEQLFIRRFTRNYNYKSPDERNAQLMSETDQSLFEQGISLPHCRLTCAHLDLINNSRLNISQKEELIEETVKCFKARYGNHMKYEIDRAIKLIASGIYYWTWRNDQSEARSFTEGITGLGHYRISNLLKTLQEALLIYPERSDLFQSYLTLQQHLAKLA
jgi:glycosyltransferase involved in cell wall biosynthesis